MASSLSSQYLFVLLVYRFIINFGFRSALSVTIISTFHSMKTISGYFLSFLNNKYSKRFIHKTYIQNSVVNVKRFVNIIESLIFYEKLWYTWNLWCFINWIYIYVISFHHQFNKQSAVWRIKILHNYTFVLPYWILMLTWALSLLLLKRSLLKSNEHQIWVQLSRSDSTVTMTMAYSIERYC